MEQVVAPNLSPPVGEMPGRPEGVFASKRSELEACGVEILETSTLESLLTILANRGMSEILVEGGAHVAKTFLEAGLVDRILLFESPMVIGTGGLESPIQRADIPEEFTFVSETPYGPDRCFEFERPL
jgi:diaminohydroxyphosphoribosylaminopyrimidine deaminase/5-amino-6-(5-phosphoribosylamino)uracil reductase